MPTAPAEAAALSVVTDDEPPADGPRPAPCPNCGEPRTGRFCSGCGQREMGERLTLGALWREFAGRVFNLNRGLLHTVVSLAKSPGSVPRDYVEGRRRTYTNPLSFFLLAATLSLLSFQLYEDAMFEQMASDPAFTEGFEAGATTAGRPPGTAPPPSDADGRSTEDLDREARIDAAVADVMADQGETALRLIFEGMLRYNTPLTLLLALFLVPPLRVLFGPARNLAEVSVFALYVVGFAVAVVAVASPLSVVALGWTGGGAVALSAVTIALFLGLPSWGAVRFYPDEGKVGAALRGGAAMVVAYAAFLVVSLVAGFLYLLTHILHAAGESWGEVFRRLVT